jgi:hypothetical protein
MSSTNQALDLTEHKRKVFFENLSPKTTTDSLKEYLSGYEMDVCTVPLKEGKNKTSFRFNSKKHVQLTVL